MGSGAKIEIVSRKSFRDWLPGKPPHRGIGLSHVMDFISGFNATLKLFTDNVSGELLGKGTLQVQDAGYDLCGTSFDFNPVTIVARLELNFKG